MSRYKMLHLDTPSLSLKLKINYPKTHMSKHHKVITGSVSAASFKTGQGSSSDSHRNKKKKK